MQKSVIIFLLIFFYNGIKAQSVTVQQYINVYKDLAIREMKRTGVPASITIAQGILETESGQSELVLKSNNHFGIKCKSNWSGGSVYHNDDEEGECFRKYNSAEESFRDHSDFLRNNKRYAFLFSLEIDDYKAWAFGLKKAGYATNPRYPYILINSIEKYKLDQYTLQGLSGEDVFDKGKYKDGKETEQTIYIRPGKIEKSSPEPAAASDRNRNIYKGTKAVYALKETSLLAIAIENKIALSKLLEYNDLKIDGLLQEDQWIFLEKKFKNGDKDMYVTKGGETSHDITHANAEHQDFLNVNDQIKSIDKTSEISGNKRITGNKIHVVQNGESLYVISKKYLISVNEIKEWNKLISDDIRPGQELNLK